MCSIARGDTQIPKAPETTKSPLFHCPNTISARHLYNHVSVVGIDAACTTLDRILSDT